MKLFNYTDPDLSLFFSIGCLAYNLNDKSIINIPFSIYETSTGPEDLDFPFDAEKVTVRPGLWYALNLAVSGNKKKAIVQTTNFLTEKVKNEFGSFQISFVIVLPPNAEIPKHRHFRDLNTVVFCLPSQKNEAGLTVVVDDKNYTVRNGYMNFDSKKFHSAKNTSDQTYWIFVYENVQSNHNPLIEITEL